MLRRRREPTVSTDRLDEAISFAWRAHSAEETWTARVDGKASTFLALEAVIVGAMVTAQLSGRLLTGLDRWRFMIVLVGFVVSGMATFFAVLATMPMLGSSRKLRHTHRDHLIYFGHLRFWTGNDLAARLAALDRSDQLTQLARQLVEMSKRNWTKHVLLRTAMALGMTGAVLVAGALLIAR